MQQSNATFISMARLKIKVKLMVLVLAWIAGLLLAGSDGPWMPYLNGVGLLIFLGACVGLGRILPGLEPGKPIAPVPSFSKTQSLKTCAKPMGIRPRYARELGIV